MCSLPEIEGDIYRKLNFLDIKNGVLVMNIWNERTVAELLEWIDTKDTPIHLHDAPHGQRDFCYSMTATNSELAELRNIACNNTEDEPLGVHLVNVKVQKIYDSYLSRNPIATKENCNMLISKCSAFEENIVLAYVLFIVFHEIGHWQHLVESGLSRMDYWKTYESERDEIWLGLQFAYNCICTNEEKRRVVVEHFNELYRKLPSEKFADEYAIRELLKYWDTFINE